MRSFQVFASMSTERAIEILHILNEKAQGIYVQAVATASAAMKARPVYLMKQPASKRAQAVRRALSRVAANPIAGEILAVYFLECRKELLAEWLDLLGIEHEDGILKNDSPAVPAKAELQKARDTFCQVDDADRSLLLNAFAAQGAIDWPDLEALLDG